MAETDEQMIKRGLRICGPWAGMIAAALLLLSGCSRETINYQLAESIGTVGKYENGEPVETPRMKEEREQREAQEAEEAAFQEQLDIADALAASYRYEEAAAYLEKVEVNETTRERLDERIRSYQQSESSLKTYDGPIPHLCFPTLIEDTSRAFDGDNMTTTYSSSMVTAKEFKEILQGLYDRQYVLITLRDIAASETDNRGITTMEYQKIRLPEGKRPLIISQDNVNYSGITNGDGIAMKLALNDEGEVKALYTDPEGHDLKGDYDLVPILDSFIAEHPDFSYRGAKGILSVSAADGIFGYPIADTVISTNEKNRDTVQAIAQALKADGWQIACAGYDHSYMNDLGPGALKEHIDKWKEEAGALVGETDILFYPYGAEVTYPSDQLDVLVEEGMLYLCGLWGDTDYMELGERYLRQTRRFVDGYTLVNAASYFTEFFDAHALLDSDR